MPEPVPAWALPQGAAAKDDAHAAFLAGAALHALDLTVRAQGRWAGAWRQRLALKCAAAACRLAGRGEDEAALRDVWCLRPPGSGVLGDGSTTLGPAGRLLLAWRGSAAGPAMADAMKLAHVAELLGIVGEGRLDALSGHLDEIARAGTAAPFAAASAAARVVMLAADAELLAWWVADIALARAMGWPKPVPLFMAQALSAVFRVEGSRRTRIRPGDDGFERMFCLALAEGAAQACRLAGEVARRAARLDEVTPVLRAKGAGDAIRLLLDDDAVPGTLATSRLSRFAARRLFQRLEDLGAVRELSGRATFKLFGL